MIHEGGQRGGHFAVRVDKEGRLERRAGMVLNLAVGVELQGGLEHVSEVTLNRKGGRVGLRVRPSEYENHACF